MIKEKQPAELIDNYKFKPNKISRFHRLKTRSEYFKEVVRGVKTFEIREFDMDYQIGDILFLDEYNLDKGYTGDTIAVEVLYILDNSDFIQNGFICMSIKILNPFRSLIND